MNIIRNTHEIEQFHDMAVKALLSGESFFPEKNYAQGILDTLQYLSGAEENPFTREESEG